jgi:hypothetical protein
MANLMISHILFNVFSKYNIGSFGFRKILAISITILIFGLLYLTVRFTGMVIPNYTRNLIMLATVDLAGFLFLMWKKPKEPPKEEVDEVPEVQEVPEVHEVKKVDSRTAGASGASGASGGSGASGEVEKKAVAVKQDIETVEMIVNEDDSSNVLIKKIVEENNEKDSKL